MAGEPPGSRQDVQRVIDERQFAMVYQPLLDLHSGAVMGLEALFRPSQGTPFQGPEAFFRVAEAAGLLYEANAVAVAEAIRQVDRLPDGMRLFINCDPRVLDRCLDELLPAHAGCPVVIELTEHAPFGNMEAMVRLHDRLRSAGLELAIDDLSSGHSSLSLLMALKPAMAKLDGTLVQGVHRDAIRRSLIQGLVRVARLQGTRLVGEQVEGREDLGALLEMGVDGAQGYYIDRPRPWTEAIASCRGRFVAEVGHLRHRAFAYRTLRTAADILEASTASLWERQEDRLRRLFNLDNLVPPGGSLAITDVQPLAGTACAYFLPAGDSQEQLPSPASVLAGGSHSPQLVLLCHRIAASFALIRPLPPSLGPALIAGMRSVVHLLELLDEGTASRATEEARGPSGAVAATGGRSTEG